MNLVFVYLSYHFNRPATQKPADDTDIFIPRGIWVVIDHPLPRIRALRIEGVLEFEQVI